MLGTNLTHTRVYNYRIVLETVRMAGSISRADIARKTALTAQTVSNITRKLLAEGLILETARIREGRGAPSTSLEINPDGAFSIGLDMDQDHLTGILMDLKGSVRREITQRVDFPGPPEAMDLMETTIMALIEQEGLRTDDILGVGICLPGPLEVSEGSVVTNLANPNAFPGWDHVPVVSSMHKRTGLPVFLENNATAAAIGERWFGRGQQIDTFFYLFFALGLGGGIIINKQPYSGSTGNAGEIGYIPPFTTIQVPPPFKMPHVGIHFSIPLLFSQFQKQGIALRCVEDLAALYHQKNALLMDWIDEGVMLLTPVILSIEYILDPGVVFFGGSLPFAIIDALRDRIQHTLPEHRVIQSKTPPLFLTAEAGTNAAALGVATIPLYEFLSPLPSLLMPLYSIPETRSRKFTASKRMQF